MADRAGERPTSHWPLATSHQPLATDSPFSTRPGNPLAANTPRMINQRFSLFIRVVTVLLVGGCNNGNPISKINRANYDQIHEKMSKEEVQAILGSPTSTSTEDKNYLQTHDLALH
jgi:hypothetical protein